MPRLFFVLALAVLSSTPSYAEDARPNELTRKEADDGWLLLFDGESTFGWKIEGEAKVSDGELHLGGKEQTKAIFTTEFGDLHLRFEFKSSGDKVLDVNLVRPEFTAETKLPATAKDWSPATYTWQGNEMNYHLKLTGGDSGGQRKGFPPGLTRVVFIVPPGSSLALRNIKLQPHGLQSVFNGKDLSGWTILPKNAAGKPTQSEFKVIDGALNVKNGPGDLQTKDQWANFVLQLQCISNGKHLNSGIFFRGRPNEYQQGYEAQIRNQFTAEPTQEYTLDVFDPRNGDKVTTKKVKLQAVDFGTGAIYRRQPARRQASKDGEWFTLTVVANGRHLSTWVNGIQVVDWTDNRPLRDNAREGFCPNKGVLSIQGHDPTTDLSFRNIRIVEIPAIPKGAP